MEQEFDITLRLHTLDDLFKDPDYTPFSEHYDRHGAQPGIERVLAQLYAHRKARQVKLLITLPAEGLTPGVERSVQLAVRRYAEARIVDSGLQSSKTKDQAIRTLPLAVLGLVAIAGSVPLMDPALSYLVQLAGNGLSVAGWVAVWYPLDSLVFQVWLDRQESEVYRKLRDAEVSVQAE